MNTVVTVINTMRIYSVNLPNVIPGNKTKPAMFPNSSSPAKVDGLENKSGHVNTARNVFGCADEVGDMSDAEHDAFPLSEFFKCSAA